MKIYHLLLSIAPLALANTAWANESAVQQDSSIEKAEAPAESQREVFSTGVAKGRDILDSAISTSSIREGEIRKLSARSLAEIFHNIAGVRSEVSNGEVNNNITVRGLPMASTGAKYLQLQEDGLPVAEFGDLILGSSDMFLRADSNIAQVEAIRGGSASTFASNSPAGIINLMSKTGDVEGGSLTLSTGVNYGEYRGDFDYGGKISDTLRFHVGGFYRQGEGPRRTGFDAVKGGQLKFNITKEFTGGHIRLYGKFLDDRVPTYLSSPIAVSGTGSDLKFAPLNGFDPSNGTLLSRYNSTLLTLDDSNRPVLRDMRDGTHSKVKSFGLEGQFELSGWTVTERFRYSKISGSYDAVFPAPWLTGDAAIIAGAIAGAGAQLSYASGPNAGQAIADPAGLNGNGLISGMIAADVRIKSFDNVTNDIRASRVWKVGNGDLTTTLGFYKSSQDVDTFTSSAMQFSEVRGDGRAALIDIATAGGTPITENGYAAYLGSYNRIKVNYDTNAAFGSLNYKIGRLALGASLRYDFGSADGFAMGPSPLGPVDMNGDGVISAPEQNVNGLLLNDSSPVNYKYHYLSYSTGVNYRVSEPFSVFARHSRGARANADRLVLTPAINPNSGGLDNRQAVVDYVRQTEGGFKYRTSNFSFNATAFLATTQEHNYFFGIAIDRSYRAYGLELETSYRRGIFNLNAGATYTNAKITRDNNPLSPATGDKPAGSPSLFGYITPEISSGRFSVGANFYGITGRFADEPNQVKMPGYVLVNPFVEVRPAEGLTATLNVNNLFNTRGLTSFLAGLVPTLGSVAVVNGRTVSASVRFDF